MNKVKFYQNKNIKLNGTMYKPYLIGKLPRKFAFIYNEEKDQDGIFQWFNHKGFTYIEKKDDMWWSNL